MNNTRPIIEKCAERAGSRYELWIDFIRSAGLEHMAEVGVYRGNFASSILENCSSLKKYYMIDPWRHLDDWNKPANEDDALFESFFAETKARTDFAGEKRVILRGKTVEVIDDLPDEQLDFAYIDGDHTLKGIAIDLICIYPKVRPGGFIGGDDFSKTIWQHHSKYEPTLVFPFAVYFAEAVGAPIYGLPYNQFLIEKTIARSFEFVDLTGDYSNLSLRGQLDANKALKLKMAEMLPRATKYARKMKKWFSK
ncbi:MAG: class I SAM-dependent methyltransferase [Deltaproteobacteria bacterium]|nr:class I SAM-dependent methyltransferase [Deltaproteobacteria bacterium]